MKEKVEQFLEYLEFQKRYSKHTIAAYRNDLFAFSDYLELFYELDAPEVVTRRMVSSFIAELSESGLTARTINRKLSSIQSFFNHGIKVGWVESNPAKSIQRPKTPKHLPSIMRSEQIRSLFDPKEFTDDFEGKRDFALLSVFYACGIRRDELINLKLESVDRSSSQLKVLGKRNKERIIPVATELIEVMNDYIQARAEIEAGDPHLFLTKKGQKIYPSLVYKVVKNYLSRVTTSDKRSPHVLRHTFATHMLNEGANLQSIKELLGHASLATTQVYTHTSLEKLKDVYKHAHPRSKN